MALRLLLNCILLLASAAAVIGQNTNPICPSRRYQLYLTNGTSYCYLYVASPLSYAAANRSCIRDGAILLSILSADENMYIRNSFFTESNNYQPFWIGLNDIIEEGTFRWENSSIDASQRPSYFNWSRDFPNDNRESLDCVTFSSDGWRIHSLACGSANLPYVCKSNTCDSEDGEVCLGSAMTVPPAPLVSPGGISAIVIVVIIIIAVLIIVVIMFCLWKFKNDIFNRFCCWCCGGAERSKVRNLQQENQRLRQQLSQHRLSVSGRIPPGQFSNALSGVPDGRGGMLPAIKQPISPMDDRPGPFLASPVGGGPPPLNIQRQTTTPGPLIGGRPPITTPSGPLPRSIFAGTTPVRPVRQGAPIFSGAAPPILPQMSKPGSSNGMRAGPVATKTVLEEEEEEEEESESSGESEEEEGAGPKPEGAGSKQDEDKDSQQE